MSNMEIHMICEFPNLTYTNTCKRKFTLYRYFLSGSSNSKEPTRFTRTVNHNMIDSSTDNVEFNSTLYDTMVSISNRSDLMWLACSDGKINSRAMQGGRTRTGEPMYIARAKTPDWNMYLGKIHVHCKHNVVSVCLFYVATISATLN